MVIHILLLAFLSLSPAVFVYVHLYCHSMYLPYFPIVIQFQSLAIVIVILIGTMSVLSSCKRLRPRRNITDSQCLHRLSRHYLLVENSLLSSNDTQKNGPMEGTKNCPWTWALDDDPDRSPRYLAKAVCPKCNFNCRAVFYYHNTLVQRCTRRTGGVCIWKWAERSLAIAYVFDPW